MKSPRFVLRETEIRPVLAAARLKHTWKHKVRYKARSYVLPDPIEHLDFHINLSENCAQLELMVCDGQYLPSPPRRVLLEKSKGLCRQVVVPHIRDALVLQCLSDALYADIKGKAPSNRSFFEPDDHHFSKFSLSTDDRKGYGSYRAYLNFQKELFNFTRNKDYLVITDIANYYDHISYGHLRNIVAGQIEVRESVLDMLIFVLSGLLWQPDYAPRVDMGLPQMDIDATRILAHSFLYELDAFLEKRNLDFVRFMDDVDIGVDNVEAARHLLKDIDLILHTRQVRLNAGKTLILRRDDAAHHFRVRHNMILNKVENCIKRKHSKAISTSRERRYIRRALHKYYRKKEFDTGNGEKILKRLITLSRRVDAEIDPWLVKDILRRRPAVRSAILHFLGSGDLTPSRVRLIEQARLWMMRPTLTVRMPWSTGWLKQSRPQKNL